MKNVGPTRHCEPSHAACSNFTLPFTRCRYCRTPPLSHAACASTSTTTTTTTTTTTRDRGDRYGPIERSQSVSLIRNRLRHCTEHLVDRKMSSKQLCLCAWACHRPTHGRTSHATQLLLGTQTHTHTHTRKHLHALADLEFTRLHPVNLITCRTVFDGSETLPVCLPLADKTRGPSSG